MSTWISVYGLGNTYIEGYRRDILIEEVDEDVGTEEGVRDGDVENNNWSVKVKI